MSETCAHDAVLHAQPGSPVAGDYRGKEEIRGHWGAQPAYNDFFA